jgi:hypothetical protein
MSSALIPRNDIIVMLQDDEWHPLSDFLKLGRQHVTPERACRVYRQMFSEGQIPDDMPLDQQIAKGRRRYVENMLHHLKRINLVEMRGRGFDKEYRLTNADN